MWGSPWEGGGGVVCQTQSAAGFAVMGEVRSALLVGAPQFEVKKTFLLWWGVVGLYN